MGKDLSGKRGGGGGQQTPKVDKETEQRLKDQTRQRTEEKHDVHVNLTKEQVKAVEDYEAKWKNTTTEHVSIFDEDGSVITKNNHGGKTSVRWKVKKADVPRLENAVLTHNHPNMSYSKVGTNMADRVGLSFSDQDIKSAVRFNMKATRAVTNDYVYHLARTGPTWGKDVTGDKITRSFEKKFLERVEHYTGIKGYSVSSVQKLMFEHYLKTSKDFDTADLRMQRMMVLANHKAVQEVAKEYGLRYTRSKNHA